MYTYYLILYYEHKALCMCAHETLHTYSTAQKKLKYHTVSSVLVRWRCTQGTLAVRRFAEGSLEVHSKCVRGTPGVWSFATMSTLQVSLSCSVLADKVLSMKSVEFRRLRACMDKKATPFTCSPRRSEFAHGLPVPLYCVPSCLSSYDSSYDQSCMVCSRCAWGLLSVCLRFAQGSLAVCMQYTRGLLKVCTRFAPSSLEVRSWCSSTVRYFNFF